MDQRKHDDRELIDNARSARESSYVPYSDFRMGASVQTEDGSVQLGAVVENVSLGLAICQSRRLERLSNATRCPLLAAMMRSRSSRGAERSGVLAGSTSDRNTRPVVLALVAARTDGQLTYPCGACLQVALELGGPELRIIVADAEGDSVEHTTVGELLPKGPNKK